MKIIKSVAALQKEIEKFRRKGKRIAFVPTMGALHEGHLSLVRHARAKNNCVVVSIFVNPLQFGPKEDLKKYPRNLKADARLLARESVDFLFFPSVSEIYPKKFNHYLNPGPLAKPLCGAKRPGHFRGVVTVVNRLFEIVRPDAAYFGRKDYQQFKVIEDMTNRRKLPVRIVGCPLVRGKDGLALSSRNQYLSRPERKRALSLYRALREARRLVRTGVKNAEVVKNRMKGILATQVDKIDYIEIVHPETLKPVRQIQGPVLAAVACFVGKTRLIDNLLIKR